MKTISYFTWMFFFTTLSWYLIFIISGETFTVIRWISYISPWLISILLILFLINLFNKNTISTVSILLLTYFLSIPYIPNFTSSETKKHSKTSTYKVMTYSKMGRNHDTNSVIRSILKETPDILFIQEISNDEAKTLVNNLSNQYGSNLSHYADNNHGLILSRFKIITAQITKGVKEPLVTIELPEKNIRVWNVHLQKSFFDTNKQYTTVEHLANQVAKEESPILIAGDFNATGINYPCMLLKEYLKDAFEESGFGFGFTFPSPARKLGLITPFIRIDHIFYSRHFYSHRTFVANDNGNSDHYPVVTLLSFKDD